MSYGEPSYGLTRRFIGRDLDEVDAATRAALAAEGFGVLTHIDVQATLKAKIGVERPPYRILGACNPPIAHQALEAEPGVGLLMPCNVVVAADGDAVVVSAIDPLALFGLVGRPEVAPLAQQVKDRLLKALERI